ncbi:DUF211 domain-containing protein [Streptomyces sp. PTM05]|uniref:DUF211 domain-containing protein n=1 Tax=Streptantibioticus parmotrematis TaxID=2873249 RepID=A0ABS7R1B9_9ACTN|nr:DUF211 domain-containing protein [Streptantibioticus parmotrematis]MBY8889257.1 DUF211 domain-containing protein [Streptantibioticus parmotrematis]
MPIRRLVLDIDKTVQEPDLVLLARTIEASEGVDAVSVIVTDIDIETVGTDVTVEGPDINVDVLIHSIEHIGAVVHSIDQVVAGDRLIEGRLRRR